MDFSVIHEDVVGIGFKVSSDKCDLLVSSFDKTIDKVLDKTSPEYQFITTYIVDIYAADGLGEKKADVGYIKIVSFEAENALSDIGGFLALCDMSTASIQQMAVAITDKDGNIKKFISSPEQKIMYVQNLYIEENWRGLGIGTYLLENINALIKRAFNNSHHVIVLNPCPKEKSHDYTLRDKFGATAEEKERLIKFCERAEYGHIEETGYMYKTLF